MKILHCSDIHLGKRPFGTKEFTQKRYLDFFNAFDQLIEKGIEENIELFIVAGDLFDKKELTPDVLRRCEKSFEKLKKHNISSFIIEGNHDNINENDLINSWTNYLEKKNLLVRGDYIYENGKYEFDKFKIKDLNIYGLGYPGFAVDDVMKNLAEIVNPEEKNIVVVHTALGGGDYLPGLVSSDAIKMLEGKVIYIAGGHLHSYQSYPKNNPYFFIPGSSEYWNVLNEKSDIKGGIIFDTETLEHNFIPIAPRTRIKVTFNAQNRDNISEEFEMFCQNLNLTGEELVITDVLLNENGYVDVSELEKILETNGALKGYIELKYPQKTDGSLNNKGYYSVKDVEKSIIESWDIFKNSDSVAEYLQKFKEYQEDKDREEDFYNLFDQMLEEELTDEDK